MSFFLNPSSKTLKRLGLAAILLFLGLIDSTEAQSGRRSTKPASPPPPTPASPVSLDSTNIGTSPVPRMDGLQQKVKLLIGRQPTRRRLQSEDVILASFVNRLNQDPNVTATSAGDMKHTEAVILAKTEPQAFVVLVSFEIDSFQAGTIILNSPDLQIDYLVLAPQTGKKQTNGKVYFQAIGGGRMRKSEWPGGTPIRITPEAAGIEAADHVHDWLRLDEMRKRNP
ncbi:MAG TPA: hypothetical protein VMS31_00140 [Pyrinomonadaceae bacterium]|nr:hypothetical protein [Pyrinomonadaceae bacterium]